MWLRSLISIVACAAGTLAAGACTSRTSAAGPAAGGGGGRGSDLPVVTALVTEKDVPIDLAAIGNVESYTTISVRSQVTGQLRDAAFREGDSVKKGDLLFTIDRRPFEAALQQEEANLARDQASAQSGRSPAQSRRRQRRVPAAHGRAAGAARCPRHRLEGCRGAGAIRRRFDGGDDEGRRGRDRQRTSADRRAAGRGRQRQVQLGYTAIRSPINGRTGNLTVKAGNLVTANQTELMTIAQVEPVYVTFSVPASTLPTIKRHMAEGQLAVVATPQDADARPAAGTLTFSTTRVDMTTDTIKLKATFPNGDHKLWPGQFVRASACG